jgi:hypothetical protein
MTYEDNRRVLSVLLEKDGDELERTLLKYGKVSVETRKKEAVFVEDHSMFSSDQNDEPDDEPNK